MRWLGALLLSLWLAVSAHAQISLVQVKHTVFSSATAQTSISVTLTATGAGNLLVCAGSFTNTATTVTLADGHSDTVTDSGQGIVDDGDVSESFVKAFFSPATGVTSITATYNASVTGADLTCWEVSGISSASFDKVALTNPRANTAGPASSGSTGTLTQANEFAIGFMKTDNGFTGAIGTGWSLDFNNGVGTVGNWSTLAQHIIVSSTSALTATATLSSSPDIWVAWAATIKGTVGGGGPTCPATLVLLGVGC